MPILGITASSKLSAVPVSFESIATVTLTSAQSTFEFTSIPGTFKHLQIRGIGKMTTTDSGGDEGFKITYNNDTNSNYSTHFMYGVGSGNVFHATIPNVSYLIPYGLPYSGSSNVAFGGMVMDILDYANTNKTKTMKSLGGWASYYGGSKGDVLNASGVWNSTSAITSIKFGIVNPAFNYAAGTKFALYGIKG
jgi:hypothetical protein